MNLLATARSTIFDTHLRLEIGGFELTSSGSSYSFVRRGWTIACFKEFSRIPPRCNAFPSRTECPPVVASDASLTKLELNQGKMHCSSSTENLRYFISSGFMKHRNTIALSVCDHSRGSTRKVRIVFTLEWNRMAKSSA